MKPILREIIQHTLTLDHLHHLMDNQCHKSNYFQIQKSVLEQTTSFTLNEVSWALTDPINIVC